MTVGRSNRVHHKQKNPHKVGFFIYGVPETIRTSDLPLRRRLLYPAELPGQRLFLQKVYIEEAQITTFYDLRRISLSRLAT